MLTLALDTTAEFGSIALADEHGVREEVLVHAPEGFGQVLFGRIEALLARQQVKLTDVELFAGASGPGSFTGVRVGLSAIKAFAEVGGRRVVPISNLAILRQFGTADLRACVIDARRGEVFAALYGRLEIPERVVPLPRFLESLPDDAIEWIATDFGPFRAAVAGTRFELHTITQAPRALAGTLALMAMRSESVDPAAVEANYVRRSDAELFWKD